MHCNLTDQIAIVTGGGGIPGKWSLGKAIAISLARAGAKLFIVDKNQEAAEESCAALAAEGFECSFAIADVTISNEVQAAIDACVKEYGTVDILVNNAGIMTPGGVTEVKEVDFDRTMDINLKAMYLTSRCVLPLMRKNASGSIINISSINSLGYASFDNVAYCVSKAAVNSLTEQIAIENAEFGIRCNTIIVGMLDSPMTWSEIRKNLPDVDAVQMMADRDSAVPLGKQGNVWDIANSAVFLCSDKAGFISGSKLTVDGGESAKFR